MAHLAALPSVRRAPKLVTFRPAGTTPTGMMAMISPLMPPWAPLPRAPQEERKVRGPDSESPVSGMPLNRRQDPGPHRGCVLSKPGLHAFDAPPPYGRAVLPCVRCVLPYGRAVPRSGIPWLPDRRGPPPTPARFAPPRGGSRWSPASRPAPSPRRSHRRPLREPLSPIAAPPSPPLARPSGPRSAPTSPRRRSPSPGSSAKAGRRPIRARSPVIIPAGGARDPGIDSFLRVDVMTAADSPQAPTAGLEQSARLLAAEGLQTAISMTLSAPEIGISEAFTDRHPSIASRTFSRSSSSDSPWDTHPATAGRFRPVAAFLGIVHHNRQFHRSLLLVVGPDRDRRPARALDARKTLPCASFSFRDRLLIDTEAWPVPVLNRRHRAVRRPVFAPQMAAVVEKGRFRLYRKAILDDPVCGMFSSFPSMPAGGDAGFPRPRVRPERSNPDYSHMVESGPVSPKAGFP